MASLDHLGVLPLIALLSSFLSACEAGVVPENIKVTRSGFSWMDGTYVRAEDYNQHPQWKKGDGSDVVVVYYGSNQYWMIGQLADRAESRGWISSSTQGANTPMQVHSWEKGVNDKWKTEDSISVSVSQGDLLKVYDALQSQESQLQKAQRELEAKDKVLLEVQQQLEGNATILQKAQRELEAKDEVLLEVQNQLTGNATMLQEVQKQLEGNVATLQKGAIVAIVLVVVFGIPTAALLGPRVARTTKEKEARGKSDNLMQLLAEDDAVLDADFSHVIKDEKVDGKLVRNVRVACRGADKADVTIKSALNGCLVEIRRPASPGIPACNWDKLFQFEHSEGCFELKEDHSRLENGILDLYLCLHEHEQRVFRFETERIGAALTNDVQNVAGEGVPPDDASSSSWYRALAGMEPSASPGRGSAIALLSFGLAAARGAGRAREFTPLAAAMDNREAIEDGVGWA